MLGITIRMNGSTDALTVAGETYDRSTLDRHQKGALASLVVDTWKAASRPRFTTRAEQRRYEAQTRVR